MHEESSGPSNGTTDDPNGVPIFKLPPTQKVYIRRAEMNMTFNDILMFDPKQFSYDWLSDENAPVVVQDEPIVYFSEEEVQKIDLMKETDKLYLIKWKNLSYMSSTWEHESDLDASSKINDFRMFNKALDRESR
jgi:hypothetical protein